MQYIKLPLNLEIGLINNCISKNLYSHVVGHGLTIRGDYITSINGFNSKFWCEDIYLTGLLHNNHEKILSLNSLDNAENPNNLNWMPAYQDVLNQMGKGDQYLNHRLLTFVVRRISELGYDINDHPFKLTRYR